MVEKKNLGLDFVWETRLRLRAEASKLWAEGAKLRAEGDKLRAEGDKLWAKADKLWAEGTKLRAEASKLWAEAVLKGYGNIKMTWAEGSCTLETGEVFKNETGATPRSKAKGLTEESRAGG